MKKKIISIISFVSITIVTILFLWLHNNAFKEYPVKIDLGNNKYSILKGAVNVDAVIEDEHTKDDDSSRPNVYSATLYIGKGNETYQFVTVCIDYGNISEVIDTLQKSIKWKGKYFLVPTSCGGGNSWRCEEMHIFIINDNHLQKIGEATIDTRDDCINGKFHIIYDKFEGNNLTSHASAPAFTIFMHEVDGKLIANLSETWAQNQDNYKQYQMELDSLESDSNVKAIDLEGRVRPLFNNMILSKYCQRQDEFNKLNLIANRILNQDIKTILDSTLTIVIPGELPEEL